MSARVFANRVFSGYYHYTDNGSYLTQEQREFYEQNGFIVIRNLVDHDLLDECKQRFIDICNRKVDPGSMTIMKDVSLKTKNIKGEFLVNKIQDFTCDNVLYKYVTHKPVVDVVESIIGPDITAFHNMVINKPPNSERNASRHPLHQDLHFFPFGPSNGIVAVWTAMERINEENGCLFVVPSSHKGPLHKHDYPPGIENAAFHGVLFDDVPTVNLVMEKGDTVFFHPNLLHGSGPNLTKGFRKAISCHYAKNNSHFIDVRGTDQEAVAEELTKIALTNFKIVMNISDMWRYKSRLVRGQPGNFQKLPSHL